MRLGTTLALVLAVPAAGQTWAPVGPTGGDVRSLASDPRDDDHVLLGTADGVVYSSSDGGRRWQRLNPGFPKRGMSLDNLLVDSNGRVFVGYWEVEGVGGGVARSMDHGRSFTMLPGIEGESVRALASAASHPDILVAGTLSGVFRSEDAGETWDRISPPGHAEIRNVESVAIDPLDPRIVYVGTWHLPWKTDDAGRQWRKIHAGMVDDSDVFTMTLDQRDPRTVYATACTGIYRSKDAAGRWTRLKGIPTSSRRTRAFSQDPRRPATLYAGTTEGLFVSDDDGASWRLATSKQLVVNAVVSIKDAILLGADAAGVLRSEDGGRGFTASNDGFAEHLVSRLLFAAGRLVAGIMGDRQHSGVLVAPGPQGPWTKLGEGLEGREVLAIATAGDEVLAGTDDGIFLSESRFGRWRRLGVLENGIDLHPRVADVAASADGRLLLAATSRGLLRSDDAGAAWQRLRLGLAEAATAVALSPRDPQLVLATTALAVFRSRDAGSRWQPLAQGVGTGEIRALRFMPADDRIVFAATRGGLLRSADGGRFWDRRGAGLPLSDIAGLDFADDGRTVYASDFRNGGLYVSRDAGASWAAFTTDGLLSARVFAVAVDPQAPGRLFAGASTGGLHVLEPPAAALAAGGGQ